MNEQSIIDWTDNLIGDSGLRLIKTLQSLPFSDIGKYPPPKERGLPLGREVRIFRRYIKGRSSIIDPSAFSRFYLRFATKSERHLYKAFVLGDGLMPSRWNELIGEPEVSHWRDKNLLFEDGKLLHCAFRVVSFDGFTLIIDPPASAIEPLVYIGPDSMLLYDFLSREAIPTPKRSLDVGPGSGLILLSTHNERDKAVGVDINPRAVRVAGFNARMNNANCEFIESDVFNKFNELGKFDLITWNTPFEFLPSNIQNFDSQGQRLGIEITLNFIDLLPELLSDTGHAYLLTTAPVMLDGTNAMEKELRDRAPNLKLSIKSNVIQWRGAPRHRISFYREHGVDYTEFVILDLSKGEGKFKRIERPLSVRVTDGIRQMLHLIRATRTPKPPRAGFGR